jgi:hypothetical protein
VLLEPQQPSVVAPRAKAGSNSLLPLSDGDLALLYWPWLGQRLAVTVRVTGDSYQLTAKKLTPDKGAKRSWTSKVAKTVEVERLLATLNPLALADHDPCDRSSRDGTFWLVTTVVGGTTITRSRNANCTLALAECRSFDEACRRLMQMAGITCEVGKHCRPDEARALADAGVR